MSELRSRRGRALVLIAVGIVACDDVLGAEFDDPSVTPEPPTVEELIETICEQMTALECEQSLTETGCQGQLNAQRTNAADFGCTEDLREYLACVNDAPIVCRKKAGEPSTPGFSDGCEPFHEKLSSCESAENCNSSSGADGGPACRMDCGDYAGECSSSETGLACICTSGPNQGTTFTASDCLAIGELVDQSCR